MRTETAFALTVQAALLVASPARAQSASNAAAEALFERGRELSQAGRHEEACDKYAASQKLDPALGTLLYLGDCYERTGKLASAWATFREAASLAQVSGQRQRQEAADARWSALEPRLSRVVIDVPAASQIEGLEIALSGVVVPRASWGVALPVDPGDHRIDARAPDREPWLANLRIEGESARENIEVPPLAARPARQGTTKIEGAAPSPLPSVTPVVRAQQKSRAHIQRIAGIAVGAAGLGTVAAGAILGARALTRNDDSLDDCRPNDPTLCSARGVELRDEANDLALASTITFLSGGALVAGGLVLYFTAALGEDTPAKVGQVTPLISREGAGIIWGGAW